MTIYENISKALAAINDISLSKGRPAYYRGQNKNHPITSSLHRIESSEEKKEAAMKTSSFVKWLIERNDLLPSVEALNVSSFGTNLVYWTIAQHYGYKTDLIDFTTSLNIAAAFSLLGRNVGEIGVIYCLWEKDIQYLISLFHMVRVSLETYSNTLLESVDYNPFLILK